MTQRPCRVGDTVRFEYPHTIVFYAVNSHTVEWLNKNIGVTVFCKVTRCGQCGKAVPSECRCMFEDSETGGE